jgi:hypothetical protein
MKQVEMFSIQDDRCANCGEPLPVDTMLNGIDLCDACLELLGPDPDDEGEEDEE